jgi:hypothetical protein
LGIADVLAMYSTMRRASGAHFDADQRTCHWAGCPHYGPNFCNSYPGVPRSSFRSCTYPKIMSNLVEIIGKI